MYLEREGGATGAAVSRPVVIQLLSEMDTSTSVGDERIEVEFADGGFAELDVTDEDFIALNYVTLSPNLSELMFAIAQRGYQAFGDNSVESLTTSPDRVAAATETHPAVALCASPEAMYEALSEPFKEWEEFRDQVVSAGPVRRFFDRVFRR